MLGKTVEELNSLTYEEIQGWQEYFSKRPYGWREDNRAAVIAMSMAGSSKIKPEKLFPSLAAIKKSSIQENGNFAEKFFSMFAPRMTEQDVLETLDV